MSANSFGHLFCVHSFGESHGLALGAVIDGCPAGIPFSFELLQLWMERRRPGQLSQDGRLVTSPRQELDKPEILSGVWSAKTLGTPIAILTFNGDVDSKPYLDPALPSRRGHADDLWREKFGHTDPRGGGRASGRETVSRVMAGAVAQMLVRTLLPNAQVTGFASRLGRFAVTADDKQNLSMDVSAKSHGHVHSHLHAHEHEQVQAQAHFRAHAHSQQAGLQTFPADAFDLRFPAPSKTADAVHMLAQARETGTSYGGEVEIWIDGLPAGLGQPVFRKLKSDLAQACLSVGATIAFEFGAGKDASEMSGEQMHMSESPDVYGGVRGGLSTGERITLRVQLKPTSSVGEWAKKGRHDPCIVPRAVPVLEAMVWLVLAEHVLWQRLDRI